MEELEGAKRKALQAAVAALCLESGFLGIEKDALGALSDTLENYIVSVGQSSRVHSELASRTEPTANDVQLALIDAGADLNAIPDYSKRSSRRHLPRQVRSHVQLQPKSMQVGTKPPRPPNVPSHLPVFPDPHTYIRTPTFTHPVSDYKAVRQKLATQKRNARRGLSKLLAKVRPSQPIAGEIDPYGHYTVPAFIGLVVRSPDPTAPLYLQALMPTPEDRIDTVTSEKTSGDEESPENSQSDLSTQEGAQSSGGKSKDPGAGGVGDSEGSGSGRGGEQSVLPGSPETYENPFLKPAKRIKLRQLTK